MGKPKRDTRPVYLTHDSTRGMDFEPMTPRGKTRFEMRNEGPLHPGKTDQDYTRPEDRPRVKAWEKRTLQAMEAAA